MFMRPKKTAVLEKLMTGFASQWMDGNCSLSDVVISSRVRLARNLKDKPFPHLLEEKEAKQVEERILKAIETVKKYNSWGNMVSIDLSELTPLDRNVLVEKHLISPQHAKGGFGSAVAIKPDETVSIMVNEEDHLRIQALASGLELEEAIIVAGGIDDLLDAEIDFAYDEKAGYLTACPTNVGTGLRASVMVHLPALAVADETSRVLTAVNKVGLVVRGIYGEGTEGQGNVFQISNQITLGQTEKEIIENLALVAKQVVAEEKRVREGLYKNHKTKIEDRVFRSLGILANARILSSGEAIKLWSDVRLGLELGMLPMMKMKEINQILVLSGPNYVQKVSGKAMTPEERDIKRADLIRKHLDGKY